MQYRSFLPQFLKKHRTSNIDNYEVRRSGFCIADMFAVKTNSDGWIFAGKTNFAEVGLQDNVDRCELLPT